MMSGSDSDIRSQYLTVIFVRSPNYHVQGMLVLFLISKLITSTQNKFQAPFFKDSSRKVYTKRKSVAAAVSKVGKFGRSRVRNQRSAHHKLSIDEI